jgi:MFS transporter, MHS family, proline/betaine transporter
MILRILQGFSYGAELPGSLTFLTEHVDAKQRGKKCGFLTGSMSLGVSAAAFISYLVTHFLNDAAMNSWGFRVPFILGGLLAFVGYFLRKYTVETPFFMRTEKHDFHALAKLFTHNYKNLLSGLGCMMFPACFVIFGLFMPSYLHEYFNYELSTVYLLTSIGSILIAVLMPFLGHLSDKIGRRKILISVLLGISILLIPLFKSLAYNNLLVLCLFMFFYYATLAGLAVSYFVMLAEIFPTSMRYTGISFCYNIAYTIAAFLPVILNYLCKYLVSPTNIGILFILIALLTIFAALNVQDKTGKELS